MVFTRDKVGNYELRVTSYELKMVISYWLSVISVQTNQTGWTGQDWHTASWLEGWAVGRGNLSSSESMEHRFPPREEEEGVWE